MASLARPVGLPLPLLLMLGLPTALAVSPSRPFRFIPYGAAVPAHIGATISCDGKVERVEMSANHLELSHWTNNRTPDELYADLSTECAVRLAEVRLEEGRYAEVMSELTTPIAAQLPFQSPCQSPLNPPLNDPPVTCQLTSSYPPKFHPKWPPNDPQMTPQSPANHPPITPNQAPITRQSPANHPPITRQSVPPSTTPPRSSTTISTPMACSPCGRARRHQPTCSSMPSFSSQARARETLASGRLMRASN